MNFHSDSYVIKSIESLFFNDFPDNASLYIDIVDNSRSFDPESIPKNNKKSNIFIRHIKPVFNLGFYNSAHQVVSSSLVADFTVVANPDIEYASDFVRNLISNPLLDNPIVIGPSIYSGGADQNPQILKRPSKTYHEFMKIIYAFNMFYAVYDLLSKIKSWMVGFCSNNCPKALNLKSQTNALLNTDVATPIYAPHGSCVIVNKCALQHGIDFKHFSFLFGETIMLAEKCLNFGVPIYHISRLRVFHSRHASTGSVIRDSRIVRHQFYACSHILKLYY
ncbi:hypothetical protein [Synechococcus sp. KORDI-49]|uniref:hypothetical protein n=1 Tax=Synechococcus sp. KORDI-49 TaxID=585423 RepID=UPI0012EBA1E0|nr:hypothetical protein [Synechococcus sp. KORDI-49]